VKPFVVMRPTLRAFGYLETTQFAINPRLRPAVRRSCSL